MGTLWSSGSESVSVLSPNCEIALSSSFSFMGLFSKYLRNIAGVSRKFAFISKSFAFIRECYILIRYKYFFYIQKLAFSIRFILELMITLLLIVKLKIYNFTIYSDLFFTLSRWSAWKIQLCKNISKMYPFMIHKIWVLKTGEESNSRFRYCLMI